MPFYFYRLKFELYSSPAPASKTSRSTSSKDEIWLPPSGTDVFSELPSHTRPGRRTATSIPASSNHTVWTGRSGPSELSDLPPDPSVIDCGEPRAPAEKSHSKTERISERQWLQRTRSSPPPPAGTALGPQTAVRDWRFGRVSIETADPLNMSGETSKAGPSGAAPSLGPTLGGASTMNKAELLHLRTKHTEVGWGVVHFYRDGDETPSLGAMGEEAEEEEDASEPVDCTTICIPAVPAYMSPGDFLGFVGEKWRGDILHCRMVMTSKMNRYLALLKFRDGDVAKKWRREFDGKVFNTMEVGQGSVHMSYRAHATANANSSLFQPQICHAVFVKDITFKTPGEPSGDLPNASSSSAVSNTLKPFPPPTPNLIELPTCPVCLERMDETNGLMTIPCSHVFHCTCLQNWKGAGCPVCRFTNTSQEDGYDPSNPYSQPFGSPVSNLCSICDTTDDLWICLICGHVGCGRYKGGHAKDHWKETAHSFALELETQHVWDYAGDMWVHRLIRDKGDGKVVELPGRNSHRRQDEDEDVVPRAKLENIGLEYTHLITSQLESQRAYYEEMINKMVDKASIASAAAESSASQASKALEKMAVLDEKYDILTRETLPQLERDLEREKGKAAKSQELARNLSKSVQEEKRINEGLLKRIEHLNVDSEEVRKCLEEMKTENAELKEMNRDLSMFISGQEKLKELESEGQVGEGEIEGGTASVPEKKGKRRGKR